MNDCRSCDLAVYCYSEPGTWTFRTMEELRQKQERMALCPIHRQVMDSRAGGGLWESADSGIPPS
jgi:hypothetical protein